jgi:hypothetical protein
LRFPFLLHQSNEKEDPKSSAMDSEALEKIFLDLQTSVLETLSGAA